MNPQGFFSKSPATDRYQAAKKYPMSLSAGFNFSSRFHPSHSYYPWGMHKQLPTHMGLEDELARAAKTQARLFPAVLPKLAGCEIAARSRPALPCGGDYYDVLPTSDTESSAPYLLCVADVSGKGLPASLLMSNLQATLRTSLGYRPPLMDLVQNTNKLLYATTSTDKYVTAILVNCEPTTGRCRFVNAGHNGGVLIRSEGTIEVLKTTGPPLGLLENMPFFSEGLELASGDVLSLFSDGVPEAFNIQEEEWGEERFLSCLQRCRHLDSEDIISEVFDELDAFAENTPQHDDITLLILKRKA